MPVTKVFRIELKGGKDVEKGVNSIAASMKALRDEINLTKGKLSDVLSGGGSAQATDALQKKIVDLEQKLAALNQRRQKEAETKSALQKAQDKLNQSTSQEAAEVAKLNVQTQENTKANKQAAIDALGLTDAYKKLEQQYQAAARAAKNIAATQGEGSDAFKTAASNAKQLSDRLKEIDAAVGQNQRNVGNYREAFSVLEKELDRVNTKIGTLSKTSREGAAGFNVGPRSDEGGSIRAASGDDLQQLTRQQQALQQVVSGTTKGFTSLTQEIRFNERSLQSLRDAGLADSQAFKQLQKQTNETKKEFNDFAKQQKILSSDLPAITGLSLAAKGLAGAYAVGAGASAIFGDEQGKIEKEVQKLVAIMTVLNGLQEAHELLEQKDAIATALAAAAQKAYAFVVGESTGALKGFRIALAATGIGLFVIALGALIANWDKLFKSIDPVVAELDKMANVSNVAKTALKTYGKTAEEITKGVLKDLQDQSKELNDELGITPTKLDLAGFQVQALTERINKLKKEQEDLKELPFNEVTAAMISSNADEIAGLSDQVGGLNVRINELTGKEAFKNRNIFNTARATALIQLFKDEQDANNRILNLQSTGFKQRIDLTEKNYALEKLVIDRAHTNELKEAKDDQSKIYEADQKYKSTLLQADRDFQDNRLNIIREYAQRDEAAQSELNQRALQERIDANKAFIDSDGSGYKERLTASKKVLAEEIALNNEQRRHDLTAEGLTEKEKSNIRDKSRVANEKAQLDYNARNEDIEKKHFDRQAKDLKNSLDEEVAAIQEKNQQTQNDPTISNVAKAQAQIDADNAILAAEQKYFDGLIKLSTNYNKDLLSQSKQSLAAKRKAVEADNKLLFEGTVKDIADASAELSDEFKTRLAQGTINILSSDLSPRKQAAALLKLQQDAQDALLANQVAALKREVEANKKALDAKLINEKQFQDKLAEYKTAEAQLIDRTIQKEKTSFDLFKDTLKDIGVLFKEQVLGIKTYADNLEGRQQKNNDAFVEGLNGIKSAISSSYQLYFKAQADAIDKEKQNDEDFLDRQKQRVLATAQSEEERATIERKFEQDRQKIEKEAAEKKRKLALKQATIDFAAAAIKTFATYGWPAGLIALAGLTAAYFAQRAVINQQQFAKGGMVQPQKMSNGLIRTPANIQPLFNGDNVLATVKTGEVILNKGQQAALGGHKTFKALGVPGFATGGVPGASLQAPVFTASSFSNGNSFKVDDSRIRRLEAMTEQVLSAVYASDSKTVELNPHAVTTAQAKRKKDVALATI